MNAWTTINNPVVPAAQGDDRARKEQFAELLLKMPTDAFGAARIVFGADTMGALKASNEWIYDIIVLEKQAALLEKFGPDAYLPEKAECARRIWNVGEAASDPRDKLAAFKLYADVRGFIPKGEGGGGVNVTVNNNRVMVMRDFGNDEQWEKAAVAQQTKLIEHSRD